MKKERRAKKASPSGSPESRGVSEASATIALEFNDPEETRLVAASIAVDNEGWVSQEVSGRRIEAAARGPNAASLRRTVDDWLAAVSMALKARGHAPTVASEEDED